MWHYKRGWQITINSEVSRVIHRDGLTHAEVKIINDKLFITFAKPTKDNKKNVSTNAKGKTACNAYMRRQSILEHIAKHLRLTPEGSYFLTISKNTSKVNDMLTFQVLQIRKSDTEESKEEKEQTIYKESISQIDAVVLLGLMYFKSSYEDQVKNKEIYYQILKHIIQQ